MREREGERQKAREMARAPPHMVEWRHSTAATFDRGQMAAFHRNQMAQALHALPRRGCDAPPGAAHWQRNLRLPRRRRHRGRAQSVALAAARVASLGVSIRAQPTRAASWLRASATPRTLRRRRRSARVVATRAARAARAARRRVPRCTFDQVHSVIRKSMPSCFYIQAGLLCRTYIQVQHLCTMCKLDLWPRPPTPPSPPRLPRRRRPPAQAGTSAGRPSCQCTRPLLSSLTYINITDRAFRQDRG
jgi:hypothetical protein